MRKTASSNWMDRSLFMLPSLSVSVLSDSQRLLERRQATPRNMGRQSPRVIPLVKWIVVILRLEWRARVVSLLGCLSRCLDRAVHCKLLAYSLNRGRDCLG